MTARRAEQPRRSCSASPLMPYTGIDLARSHRLSSVTSPSWSAHVIRLSDLVETLPTLVGWPDHDPSQKGQFSERKPNTASMIGEVLPHRWARQKNKPGAKLFVGHGSPDGPDRSSCRTGRSSASPPGSTATAMSSGISAGWLAYNWSLLAAKNAKECGGAATIALPRWHAQRQRRLR